MRKLGKEMTEHDFQCNIVLKLKNEFRKEIDSKDFCIIAVPNGGRRDKRTGAKLKREGVMAGVSDCIIFYLGKVFFVEIKLPPTIKVNKKTGKTYVAKGYQTQSQKDFQAIVEHQKHVYITIDSQAKYKEFLNCLQKLKTEE
jgi:hypothetical protein